jgi:hypothetical protein
VWLCLVKLHLRGLIPDCGLVEAEGPAPGFGISVGGTLTNNSQPSKSSKHQAKLSELQNVAQVRCGNNAK